jgi:hypothetical protein
MKARMLVPIQQCGTFNRLTKGEVVDLTDVNNLPGRADGRNQYFATRYTTLTQRDHEFLVVEGDFEIL